METMLPPDTASARRARGFVIEALHEYGLDDRADLATLLVSELVTNAILHARTDVVLRVARIGGAVRVEVADRSHNMPFTRNFSADASTGRGMMLVEELASSWGSETVDDGKIVWFELEAA